MRCSNSAFLESNAAILQACVNASGSAMKNYFRIDSRLGMSFQIPKTPFGKRPLLASVSECHFLVELLME